MQYTYYRYIYCATRCTLTLVYDVSILRLFKHGEFHKLEVGIGARRSLHETQEAHSTGIALRLPIGQVNTKPIYIIML